MVKVPIPPQVSFAGLSRCSSHTVLLGPVTVNRTVSFDNDPELNPTSEAFEVVRAKQHARHARVFEIFIRSGIE